MHDEADPPVPDLSAPAHEPRYPFVGSVPSESPAWNLRSFWRGNPLPSDIMAARQFPPISALLLRREGHCPQIWHRETSFLDTMAAIYERAVKGLPDATNTGPGPEG